MKIMAVDDDRSIRELLPMVLAEAGYRDVTVVSSAAEALDRIAAQTADAPGDPFECLLVDIQMPGKDGIELCRDIRKLPGYGSTPIIMLTAMQDRSFIDRAFAAGATDYATKPFVVAELHERIRAAIPFAAGQEGTSGPAREGKSGVGARFDQRLDLGSMNGVVTASTFENYLGQLARAGYRSSTFFAVHIQGGEALCARSTPSEFRLTLCRVADAIVASQLSGEVIACYVGRGNFICVTSTASAQPAAQIEATVQGALDEQNLFFEDGSPLDIEVAVGAGFQPPISVAMPGTAIEAEAVQRAIARARDKIDQPRQVTIKRVGDRKP